MKEAEQKALLALCNAHVVLLRRIHGICPSELEAAIPMLEVQIELDQRRRVAIDLATRPGAAADPQCDEGERR